jgi:hypothetical protein
MKTSFSLLILTGILISGCRQQAYLLSPFHANNHPYRALPMVSDSLHKAAYVSVGLSAGGANQNVRDGVFNFQTSLHQAHTFHSLQFYYGANVSAGNYHVSRKNPNDGPANSEGTLLTNQGNKFFGGAGAFAGADLVIPFRSGSEWRVFGVETSYQREFGEYQHFRLKLPDSAATAITRDNYFHTIGFTTNVIKRFRKSGNSFGYKAGLYFSTSRTRRRDNYDGRYVYPTYFSNTLHLTRQQVTGYVQINTGSYALNFQTGVNIRLNK